MTALLMELACTGLSKFTHLQSLREHGHRFGRQFFSQKDKVAVVKCALAALLVTSQLLLSLGCESASFGWQKHM